MAPFSQQQRWKTVQWTDAFKILEENYFLPKNDRLSQIIKYEERRKLFLDV